MVADSRLPQFRSLTPAQRWDFLADACGMTDAERALVRQPGALPPQLADGMIENVFGTFELPMGVASNFQIMESRSLATPPFSRVGISAASHGVSSPFSS